MSQIPIPYQGQPSVETTLITLLEATVKRLKDGHKVHPGSSFTITPDASFDIGRVQIDIHFQATEPLIIDREPSRKES